MTALAKKWVVNPTWNMKFALKKHTDHPSFLSFYKILKKGIFGPYKKYRTPLLFFSISWPCFEVRRKRSANWVRARKKSILFDRWCYHVTTVIYLWLYNSQGQGMGVKIPAFHISWINQTIYYCSLGKNWFEHNLSLR